MGVGCAPRPCSPTFSLVHTAHVVIIIIRTVGRADRCDACWSTVNCINTRPSKLEGAKWSHNVTHKAPNTDCLLNCDQIDDISTRVLGSNIMCATEQLSQQHNLLTSSIDYIWCEGRQIRLGTSFRLHFHMHGARDGLTVTRTPMKNESTPFEIGVEKPLSDWISCAPFEIGVEKPLLHSIFTCTRA